MRGNSASSADRDSRARRDPRVDFLRGFALLTIFVDHVPGNVLGLLTLRNLGFSDAAELFVVLAGFSSMIAYGRCFARDGVGTGMRRVLGRCLRLYVFQALMLLGTLVIAGYWLAHFGLEPRARFLKAGLTGLAHGLQLRALPASLDILPLYIVLLGMFPLIYGAFRLNVALALVLSGGLWLAVNLDPAVNLTNSLDGLGWFFNPFAWQFLFVLGAAGSLWIARNGGDLPQYAWLKALSWGYLCFALLAAAPWDSWGWTHLQLLPVSVPDKTLLAPLRLLNILAFVYLALSSDLFRTVTEHRVARLVTGCGRHSLEVFALGTMLSLLGRLIFRTFGVTWTTQLLVNGIGLALMIGLARVLEQRKQSAAIKILPRRDQILDRASNL